MRVSPRLMIVGIIFTVIAVVLVVASGQQTGTKAVSDGVVTQTMGDVAADAQATFALQLSEGDPEHEASHVFEALQGLPGIATASVLTETAELRVDYASAQIDEAAVRERLLKAGYVKVTAADATPAVLSDDGKLQTLEIADDHGFVPAYVKLAAGVPAKLSFAVGTECRTAVKIPSLGMEADSTKPATVELPALEPGSYDMVCSQDAPEGQIIVE